MSCPWPTRRDKRTYERLDVRGMNSKQDNARWFERNPALHGNLPEILIERQFDACF